MNIVQGKVPGMGRHTKRLSKKGTADGAHSQRTTSGKHHVALIVIFLWFLLYVVALAAILASGWRARRRSIPLCAARAGVIAVRGHGRLRGDIYWSVPQRATSSLGKIPALVLLGENGNPLAGYRRPIRARWWAAV